MSVPSSSVLPSAYAPSGTFASQARIGSRAAQQALLVSASRGPDAFFGPLARELLDWHAPFTQVLDTRDAPLYRWFTGGTLNASYHCVDRHLASRAHEVALHFVADDGREEHITYQALYDRVCEQAGILEKLDVSFGDRVIVLLPTCPEAIVTMLACARIGATHSVVFAGFSAEALRSRVEDAGAKVIVTCDEARRGGKGALLKQNCDEALSEGCASVERVLVYRRTGVACAMQAGRDVYWEDAQKSAQPIVEPLAVPSDHPLFLLYTSGSTGQPKGVVHGTAGYLLGAITSLLWAFDLRPGDVYWCTADVGWITGHTYVAYGPLAVGATVVLYEGTPLYPDANRFWDLIAKLRVSIFYTSPTAIRSLMRFGPEGPRARDLSSLRLLASVGEPINPEAWRWLYEVIGQSRCPIVDTWWQTETGSVVAAPLPGVSHTKPGSCMRPLPGVTLDVVDTSGRSIKEANKPGLLVIRGPWPSMLQTLWGDDARYRETYWSRFGGQLYVTGDGAYRDEAGDFWVTGRMDDVLNVSGHRLGTMELESALASHPLVLEAAVVGCPDAIKGESIYAYVVLRPPVVGALPQLPAQLDRALKEHVTRKLSAIARPDVVHLCEQLPKTRSGKVMRRLLRSLARGEAIAQDVSTLENPALIDQLRRRP